MSKIFVIPDVHLKPWMFEEASKYISVGEYDAIVMLGDLVDDWNQEKNISLYNETFDMAERFLKEHTNTFWCYGNHDVSYLWQALESGYSYYAEETVRERVFSLIKILPPENTAFIHRFDNTLFSHAGLMESFALRHFSSESPNIDYIITRINDMGKEELWHDDSPLWARPQMYNMEPFPKDMLQVVGHTPVKKAIYKDNLLTLDNFSTYRDGSPIGDERFVWVDSVQKTWEYVEEK